MGLGHRRSDELVTRFHPIVDPPPLVVLGASHACEIGSGANPHHCVLVYRYVYRKIPTMITLVLALGLYFTQLQPHESLYSGLS